MCNISYEGCWGSKLYSKVGKITVTSSRDLDITTRVLILEIGGFRGMWESWASQVAQWSKILTQCRRRRRHIIDPWVGKIPWRRKWQLTPVFLPGESQGQRSLVDYSSRGYEVLDMAEATEHIIFENFLCGRGHSVTN